MSVVRFYRLKLHCDIVNNVSITFATVLTKKCLYALYQTLPLKLNATICYKFVDFCHTVLTPQISVHLVAEHSLRTLEGRLGLELYPLCIFVCNSIVDVCLTYIILLYKQRLSIHLDKTVAPDPMTINCDNT